MKISDFSDLFLYDDELCIKCPKIHVYFEHYMFEEHEIEEVAGMIRGLACAINGFEPLSGQTNEVFLLNEKVVFKFDTVEQAARFKDCIEKYFCDDVLQHMRAKKVHKKITL